MIFHQNESMCLRSSCVVVLDLINMYPAHGGGERGYESCQVLWRASAPKALGVKHNGFTLDTTSDHKSGFRIVETDMVSQFIRRGYYFCEDSRLHDRFRGSKPQRPVFWVRDSRPPTLRRRISTSIAHEDDLRCWHLVRPSTFQTADAK